MKNLAKKPAARDADARALGRALIDAARASGLSTEELMSRATTLSTRASGAMQIASMQRTRQLRLDAETAEKIGAATPSRPGGTEIESMPARGNETTKWTPSADVQAKLAAAIPPARTSNVDITLDDDDIGTNPPSATAPPRTQASPVAAPLTSTQPIPNEPRAATPATSFATPSPSIATPTPTPAPPSQPRIASSPPSRRSVSSKPPSGVDSTLSEEESPRRARSRAAVLVFFCFLLGVGGAAGVAYKLGLMGPVAAAPSLDATIAHANDALIHQRWDAPPGDNVRDITNDGLSRWPHDLNLLRIRALACDDLVRIARTTRQGGDAAEALRLAKLAHDLDPSDADASALVAECEAAAKGSGAPDAGLAPLASSTSSPAKPIGTARPGSSLIHPGKKPVPSPSAASSGDTAPAPSPSAKWL
jgi:serine/threonine-protein kinase